MQGKHNNDARRAYQIAALAIAADRERYRALGELVQMTDRQVSKAADYGAEIHRSWRRVLNPLWMPESLVSKEVRLKFDPDQKDKIINHFRSTETSSRFRGVLSRFDWHSQVTLEFIQGDGAASWSRSSRTIRIPNGYIHRFVLQGELVRKKGGV